MNYRKLLLAAAAAAIAWDPLTLTHAEIEKELLGPVPQRPNEIVQSPDGSRIAWVIPSGSRWAALIDGQQGPDFDSIESISAASPLNIHSRAAVTFQFSPEGSRVAYVGRRGSDYVLVVDGEPGPPYSRSISSPIFSEDGKRFVYLAPEGDPPQATRGPSASASGPPNRLIIDGEPSPYHGVNALSMSPTGRYLLFQGGKDGEEGRYRFVLDGDEVLSRSPIPQMAMPGGGLVAWHWFTAGDEHIAFIERAAGEDGERVVHNGRPGEIYPAILPDRDIGRVQLSEDGQSVSYFARIESEHDGPVRLVLDGEEKELEGRAASGAAAPRGQARPTLFISPDGKRFAYERATGHGRQYVIDGEPGPEFTTVRGFTFSPDGGRYAYTATQGSGRGARHFVVVDGTESPSYAGIETAPVFSADGSRWAYIASEGNDRQMAIVDGETAAAYRQIDSLTFSPDGSRVAFYYFDGQGREFERGFYVDGEKTSLGRTSTNPTLAFSPDGERFAVQTGFYTTYHNVQLIVDGEKLPAFRQWAGGSARPEPFFSEDGQHVIHFANDENAKGVLVVDGKPLPGDLRIRVTSGHLDPHFLPDGRLQYYSHEDGELHRYRVALESGTLRAGAPATERQAGQQGEARQEADPQQSGSSRGVSEAVDEAAEGVRDAVQRLRRLFN